MNIFQSIKTAFGSISRNKLTSALAVLGVTIGVASVGILVSVGQGVKDDVASLIQGMGTNVIVVLSGKIDTNNLQGTNQTNPANFIDANILTLEDVDTIKGLEDMEAVSPIALVAGQLSAGDNMSAPTLAGVYPEILDAMRVVDIEKGQMFTPGSKDKVIVLGHNVKQQLFGDEDPIGQKVTLTQQGELEVVGYLAESKSSASFASEINTLAMVPFDTATDFNKGQIKILRIVTKANDEADAKDIKEKINSALLANHGGEENFTVLTQEDLLDLFGQFLDLATAMVSAIAAVSIIVGGIGIMNIMLVSVTERTREIGIRKAVGASRGAVMGQFLIEAVVITFIGGLLGLAATIVAGIVIRQQSSLNPSLTLGVILLAVGVSIVVGLVFGLLPALRASRKDPINALRYE